MASEFQRVAPSAELGPGAMKPVRLGDEDICLVNVDGELFAIGDLCTHAGGALSGGSLEGYEVECPLHGSVFDVRTGEPTALPADSPVKTYLVRQEGDDLLVGPR